MNKPKEVVAWLHDYAPEALVITDAVKNIWLKAKPEHVEHYNTRLIIHPHDATAPNCPKRNQRGKTVSAGGRDVAGSEQKGGAGS